ncbi:MAG: elongation factor G [Candidatus Anammoxibacter sp.]
MANREVKNTRNIVLIGHSQCGKTSLAEAMLFKAKVTKRLGNVDDGTSILDYETDEIEKKHTMDSSIAHFNWNDKDITIIDTPGYSDFIADVITSLVAADVALLEISGVNGIQIDTLKVWNMAKKQGLGRAIVVTKMDVEKVNSTAVLEAINDKLGKECIPLNLPKGEGRKFEGVAGTFKVSSDDDDNENIVGDVKSVNEKLIESIVSIDDDLMEKYLDGAEIEEQRLKECINAAIANSSLVPVFFCSSSKGIGIKEILDNISEFFPSPENVSKRSFKVLETGEEIEIAAGKEEQFTAQVFKSVIDPFVGKLSFFRVFSGTIVHDDFFYNCRTKKTEKCIHMFNILGKKQIHIETAVAGDIVAVSKIDDIEISDTICAEKRPGVFPEINFPTSMVSLALEPKGKGSEQKISEALTKLSIEDKTFKISHDVQTHELVVTGTSNLHLGIMLERMKKRFEIEVNTKPPRIPYKETITVKASAKYKHKKQSGGHGQYGEVYIRVEPLERGSGFSFKKSIVGGSIPGQYIPAVEKGIKETLNKGLLCGHPIVDLQVELYDGSFHAVDSSEAAFKIAGAKALHEAFNNAKPTLLEPVVNIEVVVPGEFMGEISGNLSGRRGHIQGMDTLGEMQVVKGSIPMSEITNYESELKSITGGQGTYTIEFSHYDTVASHIASTIISNEKKQMEK